MKTSRHLGSRVVSVVVGALLACGATACGSDAPVESGTNGARVVDTGVGAQSSCPEFDLKCVRCRNDCHLTGPCSPSGAGGQACLDCEKNCGAKVGVEDMIDEGAF